MKYNEMSESISKNNELENEMTLDMSYFWYSDVMWQTDRMTDTQKDRGLPIN